jgi:hypothetical protein
MIKISFDQLKEHYCSYIDLVTNFTVGTDRFLPRVACSGWLSS